MTSRLFAGGRYTIERTIGAGGMAVVYRAHDEELDRDVAIKVLADHHASDPEFRQRFLREARLAAPLSHPNIVSVYDAGEVDGSPYIVMELVEGTTLAAELKRRNRLPPAEAIDLGVQACAGLQHAHAGGLVHRDVKPQNLLLGEEGVLKIADFGIARAIEGTQLTLAGTILGTAAYLSPEQAAGEPVTPAADLYSLGAVLYEAIGGRPPFDFETLAQLAAQHRDGTVESLRELAPETPSELDDLVRGCLAREPAARPDSAASLGHALAALSPEPLTVPLPGGPPDRPTAITRVVGRRRPRRLWAWAAAAVVVAALVIGLLVARGGDSRPKRARGVQPVAPGTDSGERARNLADWIRENS